MSEIVVLWHGIGIGATADSACGFPRKRYRLAKKRPPRVVLDSRVLLITNELRAYSALPPVGRGGSRRIRNQGGLAGSPRRRSAAGVRVRGIRLQAHLRQRSRRPPRGGARLGRARCGRQGHGQSLDRIVSRGHTVARRPEGACPDDRGAASTRPAHHPRTATPHGGRDPRRQPRDGRAPAAQGPSAPTHVSRLPVRPAGDLRALLLAFAPCRCARSSAHRAADRAAMTRDLRQSGRAPGPGGASCRP